MLDRAFGKPVDHAEFICRCETAAKDRLDYRCAKRNMNSSCQQNWKPKQQSVVDIINDCPEVDTIYLIGAVLGKTDIGGKPSIDYLKHISDGARAHSTKGRIGHSVVPTMLDRKNLRGRGLHVQWPRLAKLSFLMAQRLAL